MISAFVGFVFCDVGLLWDSEARANGTYMSGLVPVFVMIISALLMCVCGVLINKLKWRWLNDYALSICMIVGMAVAIPLTSLLGGAL